MLNYDGSIEIKTEIRPCYVNGKKALFHLWIKKKDFIMQNEYINALVEFVNGTVEEVAADKVRFCDYKTREFAYEEDR